MGYDSFWYEWRLFPPRLLVSLITLLHFENGSFSHADWRWKKLIRTLIGRESSLACDLGLHCVVFLTDASGQLSARNRFQTTSAWECYPKILRSRRDEKVMKIAKVSEDTNAVVRSYTLMSYVKVFCHDLASFSQALRTASATPEIRFASGDLVVEADQGIMDWRLVWWLHDMTMVTPSTTKGIARSSLGQSGSR